MTHQTLKLTLLLIFLLTASAVNAQSRNLLQNPNADLESQSWRDTGKATIEMMADGNTAFVVREGGSFFQDVILPSDAAGQYAVMIGRGSSERIHPGGAITGLPYLYGYMMERADPNGGRILQYLQGQRMLAATKVIDEWVDMWGIFQVPQGTKKIRFFLNQALAKGAPDNGSAARFDNLGLYLFSTKQDAQAFVDQYH